MRLPSINSTLGIYKNETFESVLRRHNGIGPGFDLLRVALSLYIFYGHTSWIANLAPLVSALTPDITHSAAAGGGFTGWTRPFHVAAVPVFFALSGFLVMGSAVRLRHTSTFLAFRFLRIFPALLVELLLCAFLIGPALSTTPLQQYFTDPLLYRYMGNMFGWLSFNLPGLFHENPVPNYVNINLWTLPSEFDCYLITALLMMTRIIYNRKIVSAIFIPVTCILAGLNVFTDFSVTPGIFTGYAITYCFFAGVFVFHWQKHLPAHWALFVAAAVLSYVLLLGHHAVFIAPLLLAYCTVFFGLINIPKLPVIKTGDYSYGIYLYGFPIAQALVAMMPNVFIGHRFRLLAAALICVSLFAAFSWHVIEKRVLPMKKYLSKQWFPIPPKSVIAQTPDTRETEAMPDKRAA